MVSVKPSSRVGASQPVLNSRNSADSPVQDSTKNMSRHKAKIAKPGRIDAYHSARILSWIGVGETVGPKTLTALIEHLERLDYTTQSLKKCVSLYSAPPSKLGTDTWHKMICAYIAHEFKFAASGIFENLDQEAMWHECQEAAEKDFMQDGLEADFAA
jgi:hypothetical protein